MSEQPESERARVGLSPEDRELALSPPLATATLPGIGGAIKRRHEDFRVVEIPAYEADGREERHLLVWMHKRDWATNSAVKEVARALGISQRDVGVAGLKDRDAVTEQLLSLPWSVRERIDSFEHPDISLHDPQPHGQKLRRGHLRANRFDVVIRDLAVPVDEALVRVEAKLTALREQHGIDNGYGPQRFGRDGANLERGLAALARSRQKKGDLVVSAGQSALFNLYLAIRRERGLMRTALRGDLLKKTTTGGLFECADPAADQARMDAGELVVTGPMFGGKMMAPPEDSPSGELEREILTRAGLTPEQLTSLGKRVPGTRRPLQVAVEVEGVEPAADEDELGPGVRLQFTLPSGSYATTLVRELAEPVG